MTIKHLYPTQRPSLDLNFARTKRLDPRVDFERFSVGTYVGNDGLIKTAVDHEPRFDHDPVTGESLGLLVEASGVNVWKYSDRWGQPDPATPPTSISDGKLYTTDGVIYNAGIAPDGTNTAIQVGPGTSTASMQGVTEPATICTFSTFVKQLESTSVTITAHTSLNFNVTFNFTTETFTVGFFPSYVTGSAGFQKYPNGWYRIWFSYDRSLQSNGALWPKVVGSATNNALLWGVQKEAGSFPTSYISTEASSVTRAADVADITGSNFSSWYNQSEGSLFSQYIPTAGYGKVKFWDGNGNNSNTWSTGAYSTAGGVFGFTTRSNQGSNSGTYNRGRIEDSTNYGYVIKHAAAIADNDFACYTSSSSGDVNLNTGSTIPATGGYLTPLVDRLILTDDLTGVIRLSRLTYYPVRLSDTILQNLTL